MDVAGTVGIAEVYEGGVYHLVFLALVQQVLQVAEVAETATYPIPGSVGKYKRGKRKVREKYDIVVRARLVSIAVSLFVNGETASK